MLSQQTSWQIRHKALWIFIQFPSGCCFVLLRPDAVPFGLLRHSSRLLGVFLKPLRMLFELLGSLLGASWSLLGRSWAVLGRSWGDLGGSWGDLGRPRGIKIERGSAVLARRVAPP